MAQADFIAQLRALGYEPQDLGEGKVAFSYTVPTGRFADQQIRLGFVVPPDFNLTPPGGPHVSPRLLPIQGGGTHPSGGVHDSPLGADWEYWSRPLSHWNETDRTVRAVMAHVRHLFDRQ